MADITWIKLRTNMFDDEKIKLIERMPEGDSILIIWVKLLAYAGKVNCNGYIMINENIAMNIEQVAIIFNRSFEKVKYAISVLQKFGMLEVTEEEVIAITNWDKHQNVEGLDKIRIQNRERKARERERKRNQKTLLLDNDVSRDSHGTITHGHATEIEKEKEKELKEYEHFSEQVNDLENEFNNFWSIYPRKEGKKIAKDKFKKAVTKFGIDKVMKGTIEYLEFEKNKGTAITFLPHASTMLNQERFNDDFDELKKTLPINNNGGYTSKATESNSWEDFINE